MVGRLTGKRKVSRSFIFHYPGFGPELKSQNSADKSEKYQPQAIKGTYLNTYHILHEQECLPAVKRLRKI